MSEYHLDQTGRRLRGLGLPTFEQVLAKDEHARLAWILDQVKGAGSVIDIGAGDGSILRFVRDATGATVFGIERNVRQGAPPDLPWFTGPAADVLTTMDKVDVALCCEVLHGLNATDGRRLLATIRATTLIVTVPNRNCKTARKQDRCRTSPTDEREFSAAMLQTFLHKSAWLVTRRVEPIVGITSDSIWLGAVCHRR